ncbi:hypothetical protein CLOACE_03390 [Clostridium acetireducens DSM 10703]|uniref:Outer membrane lipoprotein carrier protein LolA n=1 Tax=Clostridium acetireducens DSM 10703 TaxID=1121290 RepID=A0A1E8F1M1_9CLOT|nr:germination lipoprotein GerS-related protein [Clostridium acetireducens]OFI07510.1 hypothetical protein CLOACE_03390 [Clostridium acetireducens DSM 10703]
MKKIFKIFFIVIIFFSSIFISCFKHSNEQEEVLNYLRELKSYKCNVYVEIKNHKQINKYKCKQYYTKNLGARFDIKEERVIIYKGENILIKDLKNQVQYTTDRDFDEVFKYSFIGEYINSVFSSGNTKSYFKTINNNKYQVIKLMIPGKNKNINKAYMYIKCKDKAPKYLIIYDLNNNEKIKITYENFTPNIELDENLYTYRG